MTRALALLAFAAIAVSAQSGGSVSGCVVSSLQGEPIADATVTLRPSGSDPGETYITRTGDDGCFSISGISPGTYESRPSKTGYEQRLPGHSEDFPSVSIEGGKAASPLRLVLIPDGVVAGTITDAGGDPVRRTLVEILQYGYVNGKKQLRIIRGADTDDRGQYRLFHVPPGKYRVRAGARQGQPRLQLRSVDGRIVGPPQSGLAAVFYPGSPDAAHAAEIELAPGAELDGIDLHLSEQRLYSIRGRLLNSEERRVANVFAQGNGNPSTSAPGRFDGKQYEISDLPPGKYAVIGQQPPGGPGGADDRYARQTVEIADRDLEGIDLELEPGALVKGVAKAEGSATLQNATVNLKPLEPANTFANTGARVEADGSFKLQLPPGLYRAEVFGQSIYLKSVAMGKQDVPDFEIDTARATGDLTIVIAADFGKLEGKVLDDSGKPVSDAQVTLLPAHRRDESDDRYFSVSTKADGKFDFERLVPGDYRAYAWIGAEQGAPQDPEFRKPYEDRAVVVTVSPNGKQTIELKGIRVAN